MDLPSPGLKVSLVLLLLLSVEVTGSRKLNNVAFPVISSSLLSRAHGERSSPLQHAAEADSSSAHGTTFSRPALCSTCRLPCDAPADPISWSTGAANAHDALPHQAEPHYPHPEALRPRPSGDPAGEGVQVGRHHPGPRANSTSRHRRLSSFSSCSTWS